MNRLLKGQRGIGGILVLAVVVFIVVAVIAMIYFLNKGGQNLTGQNAGQEQQTATTFREEDIPLRVCETGDPEQCNDPIPNSVVDKVKVDDLP